jgi:hypothetical protein
MADEDKLKVVRENMAPYFIWLFAFLMGLIAITVIAILFILFYPGRTATERIALVVTMEVGFGLIIGLLCIVSGLCLAWLDITAAYAVHAEGAAGQGSGKFSLQSKSPSLLFLLCGTILIIVSVLKPIHYQSTGEHFDQIPIKSSPQSDEILGPPPPPPDTPRLSP